MNIDVYVYQSGKSNITSDVICIMDSQMGRVTVTKNAQQVIDQLIEEGYEVKIHRVSRDKITRKRASRGVRALTAS
jgi:hypothetical protein